MTKRVVGAALAALLVAGCARDIGITAPEQAPKAGSTVLAIGSDPVTGATIETNKDDYVPGEVVHVVGRGWAPGETVNLSMTEEPNTHDDVSMDVVADENGAFSVHYYDVQVHDLGVTFTLTATGDASGSVAVATFVDAQLDLSIGTAPTSIGVTTISYATGQNACPSASTGSGTYTLGNAPIQLSNNRYLKFAIPVVAGYSYAGYSWSGPTNVTPASDPSNTTLCVEGSNDAVTGTLTLNYTSTTVGTTTQVSAVPVSPSVFGQSVTFTATVTPASGPAATGTVKFYEFSAGQSCSALSGATELASDATAPFEYTTSGLSVGAHTITACYTPSTGWTSSDGSVEHTVNKANVEVSVSDNPTSSNVGDNVDFTITVAAASPGAGSPTGTVYLYDGGTCNADGTSTGGTSLGSQALSNGSATISTSALGAGNHTIQACYPGDGNFNDGSGSDLHSVSLKLTVTTIASSDNPSVTGQTVTFTATVKHNGTAIGANGSVEFKIGGTDCSNATSFAGPHALDANGQAQTTQAFVASGGSKIVRACYGGNSTYAASEGDVTQDVNKAATSLSLATSGSPSYYGTSVTFTATISVTSPGDGTPSGSVNFYDGGTCQANGSATGGTFLGSGTISSGQAQYGTSALNAGAHSIKACYGGDGDFSGSDDAVVQQIDKATTSLSLASNNNPSEFGETVSFTATISITNGAGTLSGSVNFAIGGSCQSDGTISGATTSLGSDAISGNAASVSTSALNAGTHDVVACYGGDSNIEGSGDGLSQVVNPAETEVTPSSTPDPSTFGEAVTFSATVAVTPGKGVGTPTGSVTFRLGGASCATGSVLGSDPVDGSGNSSISVTSSLLTAGTHTVRACYDNTDGNFTDNNATDPHVVDAAGISSTATVVPTTRQYSDLVTISTVLDIESPGTLNGETLTGTVTFKIGTRTVGTANVNTTTLPITVTLTPDTKVTEDPNSSPYNVIAEFSSTNTNFGTGTRTDASLAVTRENARGTYTGLTWFSSGTGTSAVVTLSATVEDITNYDSASDPDAGDIRNARVSFTIGGSGCQNLTPSLVSAADTKVGTVSCTTTLANGTYDVVMNVGGNGSYYTGVSEPTPITVASSTTGFITGGGYLVTTASAGTYAGGNGLRTNFGFTVKYNKSKTNLQGQVSIVIRSPAGKKYQIKSNAISSMTASLYSPAGSGGTAQFTGKANITDISDPMNPIPITGNGQLVMTLTDKGEPGANNDLIGFTLWNGSTLWYSSNWVSLKTAEKTIAGGNLQVR